MFCVLATVSLAVLVARNLPVLACVGYEIDSYRIFSPCVGFNLFFKMHLKGGI